MVVTISISDSYDGGNIKFIKQRLNTETGIVEVIVRIRPDVYTELESMIHMQYFSFRVLIGGLKTTTKTTPAIRTTTTTTTHDSTTDGDDDGVTKQKVKYVIENAHAVSFPEAWNGTTVCYSHDVEDVDSWKRNRNTFYTDGQLWWEHDHATNGCIYFSYFPPYSYARHLKLISACAASPSSLMDDTVVMTLGQTIQGREIECITTGIGPLTAWIIHRQHPGETMAEHYAEGLLQRLLNIKMPNNDTTKMDDESDVVVQQLKKQFTFYIVPCMCPDGSVLGHLRTNSVGANLNREWSDKKHYEAPTLERSPEVYYVLRKMKETGCDFFLDVHGDEELPYNFTNGAELIPNWGKRLESLHGAFTAHYTRVNNDMQKQIGYPSPDSPETVLQYMNVATNQISYRFDCLAITLEMPFKDCRTNPSPEYGWTPKRCRALGASVLEVLLYMQPYLRADYEFWNDLPKEDAYVATTDNYEEADMGSANFVMLKTRMYSDVHEIHKPLTNTFLSRIDEK